MDQIIESVKLSLSTRNYLAALGMSLTLPDVCGWLAGEQSTPKRFHKFFDDYLSDIYTSNVGASNRKTTFMTGGDLYALRCAFLHQGSDDLSGQRAKETLDKFKLVASEAGPLIHKNVMSSNSASGQRVLIIDVPTFCMELISGAERFKAANISQPDVIDRMNRIGRIESIEAGTRTLIK